MCFDWLFNMQIPDSNNRTVIVKPTAKTFITGLASAYDEDFDYELLSPHMTRQEYSKMMEDFNDQLGNSFPCALCWFIGYFLCLPTIGLSMLCPGQCIGDAEKFLRLNITRNNKRWLNKRGIEMALVKKCSTSWIEIRLPETPVQTIELATANQIDKTAKTK